jgi:hypothetical protein
MEDSGVSKHMPNLTQVTYDLEYHTQAVTIGKSDRMYNKYKGKLKGTTIQQDGQYRDLIPEDVICIPDIWFSLLSITKALKNPEVQQAFDLQETNII